PNQAPAFDFTIAASKSVNAVVHVKTQYDQPGYSNPIYDFFFGDIYQYTPPQRIINSGSGVIISANGYIVTNNHVVASSEYIEVVLNDKRSFKAEIIGTDPKTDIALLKIEADNLPFLVYGDSDALQVGEWVLAAGNPFNLTSTVTAGIVSAKARNLNILSKFAIESFIQTDAAVNPGNSGGALVNTNGELVGINTAIASNTGSFTGYSFAIPVNIVKKIVSDIIEFGEVQRAYLGVYPVDIDAVLASKLGINKIEGVYIEGISENGAAADGGIKAGDIITQIGNVQVNNVSELQEQISRYRPGDKINVNILRESNKQESIITLKNRYGGTNIYKSGEMQIMGAKLGVISNEEKRKLHINNGLKIIELNDGKLKEVGIKKGFIITRVNRELVFNSEELEIILENAKGGILIEGIYPNGMTAYYTFGV
ncbi:MAG: trypsin-like peptidase domain-containing protein, partial [Bacteroidia bacterium]|nr:trypsin-like peptidase domain-containing protein [Bacteroidia bacterium]